MRRADGLTHLNDVVANLHERSSLFTVFGSKSVIAQHIGSFHLHAVFLSRQNHACCLKDFAFLVSVFESFTLVALLLLKGSTSPSGGNLVDGLPPASNDS